MTHGVCKYFLRTACVLTLDGSLDDQIQIARLPNYKPPLPTDVSPLQDERANIDHKDQKSHVGGKQTKQPKRVDRKQLEPEKASLVIPKGLRIAPKPKAITSNMVKQKIL